MAESDIDEATVIEDFGFKPVDQLQGNPDNPQMHPDSQIEKLIRSMNDYGFTNPILVERDGRTIIAGHARLQAAIEQGREEVPVLTLDLDGEQARAYLLADNRLQEDSQWDEEQLGAVFEGLEQQGFDDLTRTGFEQHEIDNILQKNAEDVQEDEAPPPPDDPTTEHGDVWHLGEHRLLCGDAMEQTDIERLLDDQVPDMIFTDPPYGNLDMMDARESVEAEVGQYREYEGHGDFDFLPCWNHIEPMDCQKVIWGGNYFSNMLPVTTSWIVWDKRAGEHSFFSDCELAWTNLGMTATVYSVAWQGMIREGENEPRVHPTQKPILLAARIFDDFMEGEMVADFFAGSGTTIMACEQTGRRCLSMELDPHYCDVIVQRWENFTGQTASRES